MLKQIYFWALVCTFASSLQAQISDFAPLGARWYMHGTELIGGYDYHCQYLSSSEFPLLGKQARCISPVNGTQCAQIVAYEDSVAYLYHPYLDTFQVYYDLRAEPGDSWMVYVGEPGYMDTIRVLVDSVSRVTIGQTTAKKFFVSHITETNHPSSWAPPAPDYMTYPYEIVEYVGYLDFLPGAQIYGSSYMVICFVAPDGVSCYEDPKRGLYSQHRYPSCDYIPLAPAWWNNTISTEALASASLQVYPNPFTARIQLESTEPLQACRLFNLQGQSLPCPQAQLQAGALDLGHLPAGGYILSLQDQAGAWTNWRLLKL